MSISCNIWGVTETNHACSLCGDIIAADQLVTKSGKPRQCCLRCRPGGPVGRTAARKVNVSKFRKLWTQGKRAVEIAAELDCSRANVYALASKLGLSR